MNEEKTRAEKAHEEGLFTVLQSASPNLNEAEKTRLEQRAMELFEEALSLGLPVRQKISCHKELGVLLFDTALRSGEADTLVKEDLSNLFTLNKAAEELEAALILDAQSGVRCFNDPLQQAELLQRLDLIWQLQSANIKDRYGLERKYSYLQDKMKKLEYLDAVFLPGICSSFGHYYSDSQNINLAIEWFGRAANAYDYGDVFGNQGTLLVQIAQEVKKTARGKFLALSQRTTSSKQAAELADAQERERLIAKRRAAGECEICGTKLGFFEKVGGNVRCKAHR